MRRKRGIMGWIRERRQELDRLIRERCKNLGPLNDEDRREWVMNDEDLYLWAKREGVDVD